MCICDCRLVITVRHITDSIIIVQLSAFFNSSVAAIKFLNSINNLDTTIIFRQIFPFLCPVIRCAQRNNRTFRRITFIQLNAHTCRSHTVLVVIIIPCFHNLNDCRLGCMCICHRDFFTNRSISGCVVRIQKSAISHYLPFAVKFFHIIINRSAAIIFCQIIPCIFPMIILIQSYWGTFCVAVFKQLNLHVCWTHIILIVTVIPDFFNFNTRFISCMGIRDRNLIPKLLISDSIIRIQFAAFINYNVATIEFLHSIVYQCSARVFIKAIPSVFPIVSSIQRHSITFRCCASE